MGCEYPLRGRARLVDSNVAPDEAARMHQRDVALGLAVGGVRAGLAAGTVALLPVRLAARAPGVGAPLRRMGEDLAHQGGLARARARAQVEAAVEELLAAPEIARALDRLLAGPLTDAVARSIAEHRVVERVALQIIATTDVDRVVASVLDHEQTLAAVDRVLSSREMDRVVEYIATSPRVLEAVSTHTQTLADEMVTSVRDRTQTVDDVAERTFRSWLRRPPRPEPT
jgi:hypothetical protein